MTQKIKLFAAEFERLNGYQPVPFQKAIAMQRFERGQSIREVIDSLTSKGV